MSNVKWGFLRETREDAKRAGLDLDTGIHRTGLDEYLATIFPDVNDWVHDEPFGIVDGQRIRKRPDYRSEKLHLIIEFDGIQHYSDPYNIHKDEINTAFYEDQGYKVVRIPYFIQLSNKAVETLFGVSVSEPLFDEKIPSMGPKGRNTPAFLCNAGIKRMAREFKSFPEQYNTNISFLKNQPDDEQYLVGYEFLEKEYNSYGGIETVIVENGDVYVKIGNSVKWVVKDAQVVGFDSYRLIYKVNGEKITRYYDSNIGIRGVYHE